MLEIKALRLLDLEYIPEASVAFFCFAQQPPTQGVLGLVDWRLCGALSHVLQKQFFLAQPQDVLWWRAEGRLRKHQLFFYGLGLEEQLSKEALQDAIGRCVTTMSKAGLKSFGLALPWGMDPLRNERYEEIFLSFFQNKQTLPASIDKSKIMLYGLAAL